MVTPQVESLSDSFTSIVENRDITGAVVIGTTAAAGGVLATQLAGRLVPAIGFNSTGGDAVDRILTGTVKMAAGAILGFLGIRVGGTPGLLLALAGFGGLVLGGGNWINAILTTDVGATATRRAQSASRNGTGNARVVSAGSRSSDTTNASAPSPPSSQNNDSPLNALMG
jgi:ABC-type sugar transport system substrate-binding protein